MKIVFECEITHDIAGFLTVESNNPDIVIIETKQIFQNENNREESCLHYLTPEKLSGFIGALLHVQSKFKNKR